MGCGYHFAAKPVRMGTGQSAVHTAAYNARTQLRDERNDRQTRDYAYKGEALYSGIFAPKDAPDWTHDRAELWNRAEAAERQANGQPARNLDFALPHELTEQQRERLANDFAREAFARKGMIADVSIHAPHVDGDERNFHVHALLTMRRLDGDEFARTKAREWNSPEQLGEWREKWAHMSARALERAGHPVEAERWRHGHETLPKQRAAALERGDVAFAEELDREPTSHNGPSLTGQLRREAREIEGQIQGIEAELAEARAEARQGPQDAPEELGATTLAPKPENALRDEKKTLAARRRLGKVWGRASREATDPRDPYLVKIEKAKEATTTAAAWVERLEQEGFVVASVTDEEAMEREAANYTAAARRTTERTSTAHRVAAYQKGEFVAVNEEGRAYRLQQINNWMADGRGAKGLRGQQMQAAEAAYGHWIEKKQKEEAEGQGYQEPFSFSEYVTYAQKKYLKNNPHDFRSLDRNQFVGLEEAKKQAREGKLIEKYASQEATGIIADIRQAWQSNAFSEHLADKNYQLVIVSEQDAATSIEAAKIARTAKDGRSYHLPTYQVGEVVVLGKDGKTSRLTPFTTLSRSRDIAARLDEIDCSGLPSLGDARAAIRQEQREQFIASRAAARESTAAEVAVSQALAATFSREGIPSEKAFEEDLLKRGYILARADKAGNNAFEQQQQIRNLLQRDLERSVKSLQQNEYVLVSRGGKIHRLNENRVDLDGLKLFAGNAPTVSEAQAAFDQYREDRTNESVKRRGRARSHQSEGKGGIRVATGVGRASDSLASAAIGILSFFDSGPAAEPQTSFQKMHAARAADEALDHMREDIEKGRDLALEDVQNLTPEQLIGIRDSGDAFLLAEIRRLEEARAREREPEHDRGRERER